MSWNDLDNLRLAWHRLVRAQNVPYKSLQRLEFDAFAWTLDSNIRLLADELRDGDYDPSRPSRFYIPKSSGTTRPITLLCIQDAVVYQAMGNVVARAAHRKLEQLYDKSTFSNQLNKKISPYFFKPWQDGYGKFESSQYLLLQQGYRWVAEFDFASFYDVVGHRQLLDVLRSLGVDQDMLRYLETCLETWTDEDPKLTRGHGIPQGPPSSDLLAECLLVGLDESMSSRADIAYRRYLDDIRLFAKSEKPVQRALIDLDLYSKQLGLVPQITKRRVAKVDDPSGLAGGASRVEEGEMPTAVSSRVQRTLRRQFLACFNRRGELLSSRGTKSNIRYTLFRLSPDGRLLPKVLRLLAQNPEFSDPVNAYLRRFEPETRITELLFDFLETGPLYDWQTARSLETLILFDPGGQYTSRPTS